MIVLLLATKGLIHRYKYKNHKAIFVYEVYIYLMKNVLILFFKIATQFQNHNSYMPEMYSFLKHFRNV